MSHAIMLIVTPPLSLHIDTTTVAGAALWSLALYLGFSPVGEWFTEQLNRWFNLAARLLYASNTSEADFDRSHRCRAHQGDLYASLLSTVPFLAVGVLCNYGIEVGLGPSWAISVGIIACMGCGVYELGRRNG